MSKFLRLALIAALTVPAAGCSSTDDIQDAISAINPFGESKKALPGERQPVMSDLSPGQLAKNKPVVIPGPHAVSSWGGVGGPAGNAAGHVALDGSGTSRVWSTHAADTGTGGMLRGDVRAFAGPVAAGGRAFVLGPSGHVTAVSLAGGTAWRVSVRPNDIDEPATTGGVATDGSRVYAGTAYGKLMALDADSGAVVWDVKLPEPARSAPTVSDGKVVVVTQASTVVAHNVADGTEAWTWRGTPEIGNLLSSANPAIANGIAVVPFTSGELVALEMKSGKVLWNDTLARASRTFAVSGLATIAASPVIADGVVYATGVGSRTVAIELKSGARLWDVAFGSAHTPAVAGNAVFLVDLDDNLTALDRKTGEVLWATHLPVTKTKKKRTHWAGPVLAGGSLWLVSNEGGMIGADPTSGRITATQSGHTPAMVQPIAVSGKILVLDASGNLTAYE
ncbi:outer membrane protein assembly factor BamB family protein [Pinisolibacter sp.]|uniref:outer membrane protein assembly factor BamB family protein n=1 Tax=Pinisolibacter sp. TaxID=2172024 RepID=UPI002FDDE9D1